MQLHVLNFILIPFADEFYEIHFNFDTLFLLISQHQFQRTYSNIITLLITPYQNILYSLYYIAEKYCVLFRQRRATAIVCGRKWLIFAGVNFHELHGVVRCLHLTCIFLLSSLP